jgi:endonuclease YncB( thermonuclease family)
VTGHGKGYRLRGAAVTVCKGYDGGVTVLRDGKELAVRLLGEGEAPLPVEDGKSVRLRVDRAKAEQRSRPTWKPAPDHPWRRGFKPAAAGVAAG